MSDTKPRGRGGRRTPGEITDLSRYAKGDRDESARKAHTRDVRERRVAAKEAAATAASETPGYDLEAAKRYWRGDRDQEAKAANTAYRRQ